MKSNEITRCLKCGGRIEASKLDPTYDCVKCGTKHDPEYVPSGFHNMTKTANERTRELILDALAYAYVRGWYAGLDGIQNDSGKVKVAEELMEKLMKEIQKKRDE